MSDRASGKPPIGPCATASGVRADVIKKEKVSKSIPFKYIPIRTFNSVRGALYDMQHFDELPPAQSGASPSNVTSFALTRDGRMPYLLIFVTIILGLTSIILFVRSASNQKSSLGSP